MKEKYVDEQYGFWSEFGHGPSGVDIISSDQRLDIGVGPIPKEVAEVLIREHNRVQHRLVEMAQAFDRASPAAFSAFWYGPPRENLSMEDAMAESPALCALAWDFYCEDTAGDMHVADSWEALPRNVQAKYFREAMTVPYGSVRKVRL